MGRVPKRERPPLPNSPRFRRSEAPIFTANAGDVVGSHLLLTGQRSNLASSRFERRRGRRASGKRVGAPGALARQNHVQNGQCSRTAGQTHAELTRFRSSGLGD